MPAPRGTTAAPRSAQIRTTRLDLGFRAGPHAGGGPPGRRPLGLVVGHGRQDVGIGDDAAAGQRPAQRLDQTAGAGLPRLAVARLAGTARSLR